MDDDHRNYQFLRINALPADEANTTILKEKLKSILGDTFIVCKEWALRKGWHCHAVFYAPDFDKNQFKTKVYKLMEEIPDHDTTRNGNAVWTCKTVDNIEHSITYLWKQDKECLYEGHQMFKDYCEEKKNLAYELPTSIKELMGNLYTAFENDEITERQLWVKMALGRAQFPDQKTKYADIDAFCETFKIKKYGERYLEEKYENRNIRLI